MHRLFLLNNLSIYFFYENVFLFFSRIWVTSICFFSFCIFMAVLYDGAVSFIFFMLDDREKIHQSSFLVK